MATSSNPPEDAAIPPARQLDDQTLTQIVEGAVETGREEAAVNARQADEFLTRFGTIAEEFALSEIGDSHAFNVDVDGAVVELVVRWSPPSRDHVWTAWYYVDQRVIWRSADGDVDPPGR